MKILQVNNCHYPRGGADIVYLNTSKLLEKHGHKVYNLSQINNKNIKSNSSQYFINKINYFEKTILNKITAIPRFFYSFEAKKKIDDLLSVFKPDIAHIHLYKSVLTPSILISLKNNNIPTVITLHDYGLLCPHNIMLDGKRNICIRCVAGSPLNSILHKCNRNNLLLSTISSFEYIFHSKIIPFEKYFSGAIAVSKFARDLHKTSDKLSIKFYHLYNFSPDLEKNILNKTKGSYYLYFGRLSKEKGILTLIEAWKRLRIQSRLKIVGTGELYDQILQAVDKSPNIDILGFKSGEELKELIQESSFIIVPSVWYENNPLTIIEAYSVGKPVIGSNVGGIPEIIQNGKTGYLFEMGNIEQLAEVIKKTDTISQDDYSILSKNAREFALKHFSTNNHYYQLMNIYNNIIENR